MIGFKTSNFFPWKKNNTDRNGVNTQNTHMHVPNTQKDNTGKSSYENKWYNPPFFYGKNLYLSTCGYFENSTPSLYGKGEVSNYRDCFNGIHEHKPFVWSYQNLNSFLKILTQHPCSYIWGRKFFYYNIYFTVLVCCKTNSTKKYHPRMMKIYACNYVIFD